MPHPHPGPPPDDIRGPGAPVAGTHRLARSVEPLRYRLTLAPDLDAATFSGHEAVEIQVVEPADVIVVNAAELTIDEASVELEDGTVLTATVSLDAEEERASFAFDRLLPVGPASLHCRFGGVLNDKLHGFYRSTFVDDAGESRVIATTQMEATDARRAFPCFDEPDRKAVFEVTLEVAEGLSAFSNSPTLAEEPLGEGRRRVRFTPTMKMSTYLVAFVVGPLEATEAHVVEGVPVRVVHVPGRGRLASYALDVASHALRFFTRYFDLPYPADKLDLVAIPDFAFGAMENLGCVTFRESVLLVDPEQAARTELERVADVVCHEIAHMWFGDLVTMRWWNGIWLNEAFATFMEVLAVDAYRPAWRRWVSFGLEREAALAVDGLHSTRPVEYHVGRPEEAEGMFDVLTYQKGGAVLRMLEQYLGAEVFRDGVRAYLRHHAHANTETSDLFDALETVSGEPVRQTMDSWIFQGGYPEVSLDGGRLRQSPFAYGPGKGSSSAIGDEWRVPVLWRRLADSGDGASHDGGPPNPGRLILDDVTADLAEGSERAGDGRPLLVNAGGWGFYRVSYPDTALDALAGSLDHLEDLERFNLLGDAWALTLAGREDLRRYLGLAARLGEDDEPSVWSLVTTALVLLDRVVSDDDRPALAEVTRHLLAKRANTLGWTPVEGEGERRPVLRALLLRTLGTVGQDEEVRRLAADRFDAPGEGARIDPDLEAAVLEVVAAQLRPGDYERMLERYRQPATPQEELRYLYALAAFPDVGRAEATFDLAVTEVRSQNTPYVIQALLANRAAGVAVWRRLEEQWETVLRRIPSNAASRMVDGVRAICGQRETAERIAAFLESHPLPSGSRSVAQSLERLAVNVAFSERNRPGLSDVLADVLRGAGR